MTELYWKAKLHMENIWATDITHCKAQVPLPRQSLDLSGVKLLFPLLSVGSVQLCNTGNKGV